MTRLHTKYVAVNSKTLVMQEKSKSESILYIELRPSRRAVKLWS